ncbi:MAG: hypothetical protein JWN75_35 [Candidatus Saccharibacteria bacterium]|nr:hypothetical protein [Candidatus Saccharibacteria bacterium]
MTQPLSAEQIRHDFPVRSHDAEDDDFLCNDHEFANQCIAHRKCFGVGCAIDEDGFPRVMPI